MDNLLSPVRDKFNGLNGCLFSIGFTGTTANNLKNIEGLLKK